MTSKKHQSNSKVRVMVVDDDKTVGTFVSKLMEINGYAVEYFEHPRQAIDAFRKGPQIYHYFISDYRMPDINGVELAGQLQELNSRLRGVIMTTNRDALDQKYLRGNGIELIKKPMSGVDIVDIIGSFERQ